MLSRDPACRRQRKAKCRARDAKCRATGFQHLPTVYNWLRMIDAAQFCNVQFSMVQWVQAFLCKRSFSSGAARWSAALGKVQARARCKICTAHVPFALRDSAVFRQCACSVVGCRWETELVQLLPLPQLQTTSRLHISCDPVCSCLFKCVPVLLWSCAKWYGKVLATSSCNYCRLLLFVEGGPPCRSCWSRLPPGQCEVFVRWNCDRVPFWTSVLRYFASFYTFPVFAFFQNPS